jgi:hypothetical protein
MGGVDAGTKQYDRQWSVPDGGTRFAWLQNGIWAGLDYLVQEKKIDVPWLISKCWQDSHWQEDADYQFMTHLEYHIHTLFHRRVVMEQEGVANDCWVVYEDARRWSSPSIYFRAAARMKRPPEGGLPGGFTP